MLSDEDADGAATGGYEGRDDADEAWSVSGGVAAAGAAAGGAAERDGAAAGARDDQDTAWSRWNGNGWQHSGGWTGHDGWSHKTGWYLSGADHTSGWGRSYRHDGESAHSYEYDGYYGNPEKRLLQQRRWHGWTTE